MSTRPKRCAARGGRSGRAIEIWLIALLVALVARIQIRSQVEVERSLVGTDSTTLAFLIDDLHRANDALSGETTELNRQRTALQSAGTSAAAQDLTPDANRLRAIQGLVPLHRPAAVSALDPSGPQPLHLYPPTTPPPPACSQPI